jgi:Tol biopolymer transport system component
MSLDEPCVNATPAVSSDGESVAFSSDCDSTGLNSDGSSEILSLAVAGEVSQLTFDPGTTDCESIEPSIVKSAAGDRVVFSGFCNLTGENSDGSFEIFRSAGGVVSQLTDAQSCWSISPRAAQESDVFVFVSTCDLDGGGAGAPQVYLGNVCSCGAPVSNGSPTATDALFALQAAVGAKSCGPCDCDVSGDGSVTASDALRILNKAIGLPIEFDCP